MRMAASPADKVRLFIAIAPETALAAEIGKVQRRLNVPGGVVRWIKPEQLHLTLRFLGNVAAGQVEDVAAAVRRACAPATAFQLALEGAGCFPDAKRPRVIWLGIKGELEALGKVQSQIARETNNLGDHSGDRDFQPHLTIGRVKASGLKSRQVGEAVERNAVPKIGEWIVHDVLLVQSELSPAGPSYDTLATVALGH